MDQDALHTMILHAVLKSQPSRGPQICSHVFYAALSQMNHNGAW